MYTLLWSEVLREEAKAMVYDEYSAWHIDLIGSGSDEHIDLWMKYYADDETRLQWKKDWPDYEMPDHVDRHMTGIAICQVRVIEQQRNGSREPGAVRQVATLSFGALPQAARGR